MQIANTVYANVSTYIIYNTLVVQLVIITGWCSLCTMKSKYSGSHLFTSSWASLPIDIVCFTHIAGLQEYLLKLALEFGCRDEIQPSDVGWRILPMHCDKPSNKHQCLKIYLPSFNGCIVYGLLQVYSCRHNTLINIHHQHIQHRILMHNG